MLLLLLYCSGPLTVMYNMYKSTTSCGVHLYPLFVFYSIYIYEISINKYYIIIIIIIVVMHEHFILIRIFIIYKYQYFYD